MKKTGIFSLLLLLVTTAWAQPSPSVPAALKETKVSTAELLKWPFNGIGKENDESGRQICRQEDCAFCVADPKRMQLLSSTLKGQRVLDAYCGIGTIGLIAADKVDEVIGVEVNAQAVKDANANSKRNGVENIRFVCADAGAFMTNLADAGE